MNVRDLIEQLQQFHPDAKVVIEWTDTTWHLKENEFGEEVDSRPPTDSHNVEEIESIRYDKGLVYLEPENY